MRALLYHCPEAPEGLTWIGQIWLPLGHPARLGKNEGLFGIRFTGDNPDTVAANVEAFWAEQVAKVEKAKANMEATRARLAVAKAERAR